MEITLTLWQLIGIVIASVVGIVTIISLLITSGVRIGNFVTRDDLDRTSDKLEKQIGDEVGRLEKQIGDEVGRLEKKIEDEVGRLEKKIDDNHVQLLLAIQNLGNRLENAILEHAHDEDGVAVFRRHPQMDAAN